MHAGPRWSTLANIARHPRRSSPLAIDTEMYKWRHLIESFFCKLKEFKRIALRADKTDQSFSAMIYLAAAVVWIRDVLGTSDHLKGFGQAAWIERRVVTAVGARWGCVEALA